MTIQMVAYEREIRQIISSGEKGANFRWECTIHANGKDVEPLYVIELEREGIYNQDRHSDVRSINIAISAGTLQFDVLPFKDKLEITVRKIPLMEGNQPTQDKNANIQAFRYIALPFKEGSAALEANNMLATDKQLSDRTQVVEARFQLIDPVIQHFRMQTFGGRFRQVRGVDVVRYGLGKLSKASSLGKDNGINGVTVVGEPNPEIREHVIVPDMTPAVKFPDLVNQICGGVFPSGFQFYLKDRQWFLFSPYDTKGFSKSKRTLTLMNVSAGKYPSPERSWRKTDTQLFVLATGETKHVDVSEKRQQNLGNGVSFIDATRVMDGFVTTGGNKAIIEKEQNVNQFVLAEKPTGLNFVRESETRITANYLVEYGKLAGRNGAMLYTVWENSDDSLIYPGMPVKFMYVQNNTVEEVYGALVGAHSFWLPTNQNPKNGRHAAKTVLSVFLERNIKLN